METKQKIQDLDRKMRRCAAMIEDGQSVGWALSELRAVAAEKERLMKRVDL